MTIIEVDLDRETLDKHQRRLLDQCGADAQSHPLVQLVIDSSRSNTIRFKADPVIRHLVDTQVDLNKLWASLSERSDPKVRLSMRSFYRNMGYSLGGYIDIFGQELDAEERHARKSQKQT